MDFFPSIQRFVSKGVTLLGDKNYPGRVTFAFSERTGGVSAPPYQSLNLGDNCADDERAVKENRRRLLDALELSGFAANLINPHQVHSDHVLVLTAEDSSSITAAQKEAKRGADAVVCTARRVPVLLCYADCVPVILLSQKGFAVIHSGWKGTYKRISARALQELVAACGITASEVYAYIGPHITAKDYEVSQDLARQFEDAFGASVVSGRFLNLSEAIIQTLVAQGILPNHITCYDESTASHTERFFSYRAEEGVCGRHGALACLW